MKRKSLFVGALAMAIALTTATNVFAAEQKKNATGKKNEENMSYQEQISMPDTVDGKVYDFETMAGDENIFFQDSVSMDDTVDGKVYDFETMTGDENVTYFDSISMVDTVDGKAYDFETMPEDENIFFQDSVSMDVEGETFDLEAMARK